jgi:hypothetical protein
VLVHHPDDAVPEGLLSALTRRGIDVSGCTSAHRAMAMLCAFAADDEDAPLILLLVEPERVPLAALLTDAIELYAPAVTPWLYADDGSPQLRAVEASDLEKWFGRGTSIEDQTAGDPAIEAGPTLKLVGPGSRDPSGGGAPHTHPKVGGEVHPATELGSADERAHPPRSVHPEVSSTPASENRGTTSHGDGGAETVDPPPLLTDEELSMLLSDEWRDDEGS